VKSVFREVCEQMHLTGVFSKYGPCLFARDALRTTLHAPTNSSSTLTHQGLSTATPYLAVASTNTTMPSQEAQILGDFLLAPAALRDFMTLRQFTDIFPKGHRKNPAVQDLYRELQRLREKDIEAVRRAIAEEVKRSKRLRHEYARERRQLDDATVAGLDPVALQMEEEVLRFLHGFNAC
jgi:hypothetical protein